MATKSKRAALQVDAELHRALRLEAAETAQSMSELIKEAVCIPLLEVAEDLRAAGDRATEPTVLTKASFCQLGKRPSTVTY